MSGLRGATRSFHPAMAHTCLDSRKGRWVPAAVPQLLGAVTTFKWCPEGDGFAIAKHIALTSPPPPPPRSAFALALCRRVQPHG